MVQLNIMQIASLDPINTVVERMLDSMHKKFFLKESMQISNSNEPVGRSMSNHTFLITPQAFDSGEAMLKILPHHYSRAVVVCLATGKKLKTA